MVRDNNILESYKSLVENKNKRASKYEAAINKKIEDKNNFMKNYYSIRESRESNEREHSKLLNEARDRALATSLKAIYITALEPATLTDNALFEAENIVDRYIKENGGATKIFNNAKADTYFLAKLRALVEETAEKEVEEIESINDDNIDDVDIEYAEDQEDFEESNDTDTEESTDEVVEETEESKEDSKEEEISDNIDIDALNSALNNLGFEIRKKEDFETSEELEDETVETSEEESKDSEDNAVETYEELEDETVETSEDVDSEADEVAKEDDKEEVSDVEEDNSNESEETTSEEVAEEESNEEEDELEDNEEEIDEEEDEEKSESINKDPQKNLFKELEKEKEVKDAIELIKSRVADAEEAFIKRNTEDKQKIEELLAKISDNVKTVEKIADNDNVKSKIAQESAMMYKRRINEITNNRPLTIMEKMTRNLTNNIIKNQSIMENYITESGSLDTGLVVEAAKVMYAFLETLNTLQLESVNSKYVQNILCDMN